MTQTYRYRLLTTSGYKKAGEINADSIHAARQLLRADGGTILSLRKKWGSLSLFLSGEHYLSGRERMLFFRRLYLLVSSSISLSDSLAFLARGEKKKRISTVYLDLHSALNEGNLLSQAMRKQTRAFAPVICAVVHAGEKSGHMSGALKSLTEYLDYQYQMRTQLLQAVLYPALLVCISFIVIGALVTFAVPEIAGQLIQSNLPLPLSTRMLINISQYINEHWQFLLFIMGGIALLCRMVMRYTVVRTWRDEQLLRLPLLGRLLRDHQNGVLMMALEVLTTFSVPALEAFVLSRTVLDNIWMKKKLELVCARINEGSNIATSLTESKLFDETTLSLLAAGERSGEFHRMVAFAADLLRKESSNALTAAIKVMEPVLILIVGLLVLFIFMSVMQPMLNLNNMPL